ncbi:MAG: ornithine cyclodeaminase family protein, partial [Paracoccaceae bacterium]
IGTGVQARLQMQAAHLVRPFERVLVHGRDPAKAAACATDLGAKLGIEAEVTTDAEELVQRSQLVVTTTPVREPVLMAEWLHPELHITAMGSDQTGKNEIEAQALARADLYVCDRVSQCETSGELEAAIAAGVWTGITPPELGAIIAGKHPGRQSAGDITICDLTGTGAQDTAIASHVAGALGSAGTLVRS